ncbi:MAG TPA: amidohydrolase family protein [Terriglobales bacterium]|nr:amidohydrolase family protein [Terriglobales bacterium]
MASRRQFLQTAAAGIAGSRLSVFENALTPGTADERPAASKPTIIDTHAHWIGPSVVELLKKRTEPPRYVVNEKGELIPINSGAGSRNGRERPQSKEWFDIEARLRHLDESGVQRQVLSWVGGAYDNVLPPDVARPLWRAQNNDLGDAVKKHPGRLYGLASLPTANPQWAAEELKRAHEELGLSGATLPLDAFVSLQAARSLAPIFAVAQKYRSHIFIHRGVAASNIPGSYAESGPTNPYFGVPPKNSDGSSGSLPGDNPLARSTLITSTHLATGVITLALTDFLDAYPDVSVQVAMIGGSIALVAEQIEFAEKAARAPSTIGKLRRIYLDTGQFGRGSRNLALAARVFGPDRILFGSDYGAQASILPYINSVQQAELTPAEKEAVFSANASRIFEKGSGG